MADRTQTLSGMKQTETDRDHPEQQQLLGYILDDKHPENEIIIKDCNTCLTRGNFQTLGLRKDMDSEMGNACLRLVQEILQIQGKSIHVVDLYIPPTWLPTSNCNPAEGLPVNSQNMDAIVIPLWVPGHFMFALAQKLAPGPWIEKTGKDIEGLPQQTHANDCGIFMIMYTWYLILGAPFDFTVDDMPVLRRWWCVVLVENLHLEGHGRRFAHFTKEGKQMVNGCLSPIFRLKRKRPCTEVTNQRPWTMTNQAKTTEIVQLTQLNHECLL
uniref:Ubiquitin-like protease family profile domain-containing protein n=1 Tax=Knipowitschia caucasica TaxID=637954 RepID=A0AAV2M0V9_KNICA